MRLAGLDTIGKLFRKKARERRRYARLAGGGSAVTSTAGEMLLRDICPTGMGLAGPRCPGLDSGERFLFIVRDDRGRGLEAFAEVRWSRPGAGEGGAGAGRAGVAFVEILYADPDGTWAGIMAYDPV